MEEHQIEVSPRVLARIGGVLYLIIIVLGIVGEAFVRGRIVVPGDATVTAANLRSMESLWRFGIAAVFEPTTRSGLFATPGWGVFSVGDRGIPKSICARAAPCHGKPV